ncbi:hypothetical protein [Candidatus Pantoea bituminis]|uniref:hypothetical protein n=1 Tax=Candidatus Pantoea bituminis TaxID=2831036 RepID=UPI001C061497|nr:hypothetical protein [Pantoea bituminis]
MKLKKSAAVFVGLLSTGTLSGVSVAADSASEKHRFSLNEATISSIRKAVLDNEISCQTVVSSYIKRIEEYDKKGICLLTLSLRSILTRLKERRK